MEKVNVICIKYGNRYPSHYVNKLYNSTSRNLSIPFKFHCCTEDSSGLDSRVEIIPLPENPGLVKGWPHPLLKLIITQNGFGNLLGPTLFLDLDVVITGSLDCFFKFKEKQNCIIRNWVKFRKRITRNIPNVGNSSVFRFDAGPNSDYIYKTFIQEIERAEDKSVFNTEQAFLTYAMKEVIWWPNHWVRSYKWNCRPWYPFNLLITPKLPKDCKILVFHGRPDPDQAILGFKGSKPHHHMKPASWISDYWK